MKSCMRVEPVWLFLFVEVEEYDSLVNYQASIVVVEKEGVR